MKRVVLAAFTIAALFVTCNAGVGMCAERMFVGRVVRFDPASRTLSVKSGGAAVTFDASDVAVTGYRAVEDIRKGDLVGVVYTATGMRVIRNPSGTGVSVIKREASPGPTAQEKASKGAATGQEKNGSKMARKMQRRQGKGNGCGFEDADVNKDGKVSPVELSVVIPDITMTRFREYDTDRNGCLSLSEFNRALLAMPKRPNTNGPSN